MGSKSFFVVLGILVALALPAAIVLLLPGLTGSEEGIETPREGSPDKVGRRGEPLSDEPAIAPSRSSGRPEEKPPAVDPVPDSAAGIVAALKRAHVEGRPADMKRLYSRIRALGGAALPDLRRILAQGDDGLLALFAMNALAGLRASGEDLPGLDALFRDVVFPRAVKLVLSGESGEIRTNAVWIVAECGREEFPAVLLKCVGEDPDIQVRSAALDALVKGGARDSAKDLCELVEAGIPADPLTRLHAAKTVLTLQGEGGDLVTVRRLESALADDLKSIMLGGAEENTRLRFAAVEIFGRIAGADGNGILGKVLETERDGLVLKTAIEHLVRRKGGREWLPVLGRIASDEGAPPNARKAAAWALSQIDKR
ncbi:MAG: HEAT repeat domain-containing protein [Planctomycetota bacterium]|jgi:HEAT repeat protein